MTDKYQAKVSDKVLLRFLKNKTFKYQGAELTCLTYFWNDQYVFVMCKDFTIKLHKDYSNEVLTAIIEYNFGDEEIDETIDYE